MVRVIMKPDAVSLTTVLRRAYYGWTVVLLAATAMVGTLPARTQGLGIVTEHILADLNLDRVTWAEITSGRHSSGRAVPSRLAEYSIGSAHASYSRRPRSCSAWWSGS